MILIINVHLNQTGTQHLNNLQIVPNCESTKFSISFRALVLLYQKSFNFKTQKEQNHFLIFDSQTHTLWKLNLSLLSFPGFSFSQSLCRKQTSSYTVWLIVLLFSFLHLSSNVGSIPFFHYQQIFYHALNNLVHLSTSQSLIPVIHVCQSTLTRGGPMLVS